MGGNNNTSNKNTVSQSDTQQNSGKHTYHCAYWKDGDLEHKFFCHIFLGARFWHDEQLMHMVACFQQDLKHNNIPYLMTRDDNDMCLGACKIERPKPFPIPMRHSPLENTFTIPENWERDNLPSK